MVKMVFKISKNGEISVDVNGAGSSCKDVSKAFTDALGNITSVEEKEELYDSVDDIYAEVRETEE